MKSDQETWYWTVGVDTLMCHFVAEIFGAIILEVMRQNAALSEPGKYSNLIICAKRDVQEFPHLHHDL